MGQQIYPVIEMYDGGTWGYMVYSNGLFEQWGQVTTTAFSSAWGSIYINLAKRMRDSQYTITHGHQHRNYAVNTYEHLTIYGRTPVGFYINPYNYNNETVDFYRVTGFLAEGEY